MGIEGTGFALPSAGLKWVRFPSVQSRHAEKLCHSFSIPLPLLERVMGIEPTCSAWKADILPLNYTRGSPETLTLCHYKGHLSSAFPQKHEKVFVRKNGAKPVLRPAGIQIVSMCSSPSSADTCAPSSGLSQAAMMRSARPFSISFSIRRRRLRAPKVSEYDFLTR